MKIVRTQPVPNPETLRDRNFITDQAATCYVADYDNTPLLEFNDDLVILEWDIAVSLEDLECFCEVSASLSDQVSVAPYRIYDPARTVPSGNYVHRIVSNPVTLSARWISQGDWFCDLFGFGLAYLPLALLQGYVDYAQQPSVVDKRLTDGNFSAWHYREVKQPVAVNWAVKPVHLNYSMPREYPWN